MIPELEPPYSTAIRTADLFTEEGAQKLVNELHASKCFSDASKFDRILNLLEQFSASPEELAGLAEGIVDFIGLFSDPRFRSNVEDGSLTFSDLFHAVKLTKLVMAGRCGEWFDDARLPSGLDAQGLPFSLNDAVMLACVTLRKHVGTSAEQIVQIVDLMGINDVDQLMKVKLDNS